jgi:hypothetical protein
MNNYNSFDGNKGLQENAQIAALDALFGMMNHEDKPSKPSNGRWVVVLLVLAVITPMVAAWVLL